MSLMRTFSAWTLRAMIAWAGFEASASLYDAIIARRADIEAVANQHQAAERLRARALAAETEARDLGLRLNTQLRFSWRPIASGDARAAANELRQTLMDLGAQAPVVDAAISPAGASARRIVFTAHWREPAETAPATLYALAARSPNLGVKHLSLSRSDGLITTDAAFEALAQARGDAP